MPTYHAANVSLRLLASSLAPSLTEHPATKIHQPTSVSKANAAESALSRGEPLPERTISWTADGNEEGVKRSNGDLRIGYLGLDEEVPFLCAGVGVEDVQSLLGTQEMSTRGGQKKEIAGDSSLGLHRSISIDLPSRPKSEPAEESFVTADSGRKRRKTRGITAKEKVAVTPLSQTPVINAKVDNNSSETPSKTLPTRTPGQAPSLILTSQESKALTLAIDFSQFSYNRSKDGPDQSIKIDIFLNGQLTECSFASARYKMVREKCQLRFSGTRASKMIEKAWIIHVPSQFAKNSVKNGATGEEHRTAMEKRWKGICHALQDEAELLGHNHLGKQPPSADFLLSLAKMHLPEALMQTRTAGPSFAVLDVVITLGQGRKGTQGSRYVDEPQRLDDKRFSISRVTNDIPATPSAKDGTPVMQSFDTPTWATKSPVRAKSSRSTVAGNFVHRSMTSMIGSFQNRVVDITRKMPQLTGKAAAYAPINRPRLGFLAAAQRAPAPPPLYSPLNTKSQAAPGLSEQNSTPVPRQAHATVGPLSPALVEGMRPRAQSWSYRTSPTGAKTPLPSRHSSPLPKGNRNKPPNGINLNFKELAAAATASTAAQGRAEDELDTIRRQEVVVVVPPRSFSVQSMGSPPPKKIKSSLTRTTSTPLPSSGLARFAEMSPATLSFPPSPVPATNASGHVTPLARLRAALVTTETEANTITSPRAMSNSPASLSRLRRLSRRSVSFAANPADFGPPSIAILEGDDAERVVATGHLPSGAATAVNLTITNITYPSDLLPKTNKTAAKKRRGRPPVNPTSNGNSTYVKALNTLASKLQTAKSVTTKDLDGSPIPAIKSGRRPKLSLATSNKTATSMAPPTPPLKSAMAKPTKRKYSRLQATDTPTVASSAAATLSLVAPPTPQAAATNSPTLARRKLNLNTPSTREDPLNQALNFVIPESCKGSVVGYIKAARETTEAAQETTEGGQDPWATSRDGKGRDVNGIGNGNGGEGNGIELGLRQIRAERGGEFEESEVLVGVRFLVANWA